ncbi:hypothetical protein SCLCIDRAFT_21597 [Scleroderma citrinum Foug A]|uniref:DUF6534 domain-containing protein n=1 Tax=Scleroderma citrinum Foug A TaxID=1036808 RepID=A0A0C3EEU1_9AGAM|nr:hypothetical protein SCLCIDRAFT_21597 [Scleroderma citrinum Foug A]
MNSAEIAIGHFLIGVAINILLYGIMITQMYLYFATYKRDPLRIKSFVAFLFFADTLNTLFDFIYVYQGLVIHFVFATDPIMTGLIGGLVQSFYAWRIYALTKNFLVVLAILLFSLAGVLGSIGTTIAVRIVPEFVHFQRFKIIGIIWLSGAACADVIITTVLVLYLRNKKYGIPSMDDVIDRVICLTVQTGLIMSLCAVIDLAVYLAVDTGIHLVFNVPLAKLYSNSLMSSLNSRGGWRHSESPQMNMSYCGNGTLRVAVQPQPGAPSAVFAHVEEHESVNGGNAHDLSSQIEVQSVFSSHRSKDSSLGIESARYRPSYTHGLYDTLGRSTFFR